ncbi:MFS transporter [Actinophytocola algeriensis]|uniref:MFS family permease n=1 Tax=Actinophytocola algeriensis TaxID=1768010 RepID=A0A7W7Q141_9PSEU|nr:MFS transporter [Actinophytocola algeriensis]MBB4904916.1 MFS family permease [Actinophytocola algeriensis]MBE1476224.1 MFS family permease [Actinophytocola algeriensis]
MALRHAFVDLGPLRAVPVYRRLWFGQTASGFGSQMTLIAVLFQVWEATGSVVWTGAVGMAQALPLMVFGLFAGSLVDRHDRRRLYLVAMSGQAFCSVLLALQAFFLHLPVLGLLGIVALQGCFSATGAPAARTFLPRLLAPEQLAAGLALTRIGFQGAMLAGPALGGLILGTWGVGACFTVDAVTFCAALWGAVGLPATTPSGGRPGVRGVLDGLAFLVRAPMVRGALLTDVAATVLSMPISLFPLINAERFGNDPRTLGLFLSAIAVGGVIASVLSGVFTRRARQGVVMLVGATAWGVALAAFALVPDPWLGLACLVVAGGADTVSVVARSTIIQLNTPDAMLGRVSAAEQIVGQGGPEVGNLRGGLVAAATSGTVALVSGGMACVAIVTLIGAVTPRLRNFRV